MDAASLPPRVQSFYQLISKWPSHQQQQAVYIFKQLSQLMDPDDAADNFLDQWPDGPASLQDNESALQRLLSNVQEMFGIDAAQAPAPQPAAPAPAAAAAPSRQEAAPAAAAAGGQQHSQPVPVGPGTHSESHAALGAAEHAAPGQWPGLSQPASGLQGAAAAAASQPGAAVPVAKDSGSLESQPTESITEQSASSMDIDVLSAGTCYSATPAPAASSCSIASFDAAAAAASAAGATGNASAAANIAGSTPTQLMKMLMEEQKRRRAEQARKAKEMKHVNKQLQQAVQQIEQLEAQLTAQGVNLQGIDLDSISEQQLLEELQQQELQEQELLQQEAAADAVLKVLRERYSQLQEQDRKEDARLSKELMDLMTDLMS